MMMTMLMENFKSQKLSLWMTNLFNKFWINFHTLFLFKLLQLLYTTVTVPTRNKSYSSYWEQKLLIPLGTKVPKLHKN